MGSLKKTAVDKLETDVAVPMTILFPKATHDLLRRESYFGRRTMRSIIIEAIDEKLRRSKHARAGAEK